MAPKASVTRTKGKRVRAIDAHRNRHAPPHRPRATEPPEFGKNPAGGQAPRTPQEVKK